ncbi:hypothetical protein ADUPG1_010833 [Aduncisulcus paluster]|uniref:Phosphoglucomutase n=1 Tax=Aduncisulcus paluster TaxID=2918883 RepID=A0ABQ5JT77_9EUKA|nr:hypothetical protein ADUPG1_010833 [Aduncisulcus paluster]
MVPLMASISGIRGIVNHSLTPMVVSQWIVAFCRYIQSLYPSIGSIIIGRDSRPSGSSIVELVRSIIEAEGLDVIDVGVVPTPTVQVCVLEMNRLGSFPLYDEAYQPYSEKSFSINPKSVVCCGIIITASHNPLGWNGIKMVDASSLFIHKKMFDAIHSLKNSIFAFQNPRSFGILPSSEISETDLISVKDLDEAASVVSTTVTLSDVDEDSVSFSPLTSHPQFKFRLPNRFDLHEHESKLVDDVKKPTLSEVDETEAEIERRDEKDITKLIIQTEHESKPRVSESSFRMVSKSSFISMSVSEKSLIYTFKTASAIRIHTERILDAPVVKNALSVIRNANLRVALDCGNGAGAVLHRVLLPAMRVVPALLVFFEPHGIFERAPEPIPRHLDQLRASMFDTPNLDFGYALDPDADRFVIVDEEGTCVSEDNTLAICADYVLNVYPEFHKKHLQKKTGHKIAGKESHSSSSFSSSLSQHVVKNMSTSSRIDSICPSSATMHTTHVGEIYVADQMRKLMGDAVCGDFPIIGGEGNGGVLLPQVHLGRDSGVAFALVAAWFSILRMNNHKLKFSEALNERIPQLVMIKHKIELSPTLSDISFEKVAAAGIGRICSMPTSSLETKRIDGIRIDCSSGWVHVRCSNTEPVVRIIAEAEKAALASEICEGATLALSMATK